MIQKHQIHYDIKHQVYYDTLSDTVSFTNNIQLNNKCLHL